MRLRNAVPRAVSPLGLAAALAATGCGDAAQGPAFSAIPTWEIESVPLVLLGERDHPAELFSRIAGVALLGDGGIVVGDGASGTLRVFGSTGTFEVEMGGEGQGPGEFEYLNSIHALPGDTLLAYDPSAYRVTAFSRSGRLLSTAHMETAGGAPEFYFGRDPEGRHLVSLVRPTPRDPSQVTADQWEVRRYEGDGSAWVTLGSFPGMRRVRSPVPFSPHLSGAVVGGTLLVTDGLRPVLTAFQGTDTTLVEVEVQPGPWSLEEAWRRLAASLDGPEATERLEATRSGPPWDSIPRYADMLPDPTGAVWLKDYDPGTDSHWVNRPRNGGRWTLVSLDGRAVAAISLPDDFRLMSVGADRLAGVSRGDLGVERVVVYRLVRSAPQTGRD